MNEENPIDEEESKGTLSERLEELKELFLKEEISAKEYSVLKSNLEKQFSKQNEETEDAEEDKEKDEETEEEESEEKEEKPKSSRKSKKTEVNINEEPNTENRIGWMVLAGIVIAVLLYSIVAATGTSSSLTGFAVSSGQGAATQKTASTTGATQAKIVNGVQEVNMDVGAGGYSPKSFILKKGVPVVWNVNAKQLTGCNRILVARDYNINVNLQEGLNVIKFTPDKTGTIKFSCSMGMIQGTFLVTETGTATQQEIASATPQAGSCGGGSGGGCGGGCGG